jgi:hypothetical protein
MNDYDPQVNIEINGNMIKKFLVKFGKQVNILPLDAWKWIGIPPLAPTMNFLKLVDQIFIKPIRTLKNVKTNTTGIPMMVEFEMIDLVKGFPSYPTLVGIPWGKNLK